MIARYIHSEKIDILLTQHLNRAMLSRPPPALFLAVKRRPVLLDSNR
jgi:hypothetical protein